MPRLRAIGLAPAATFFMPPLTIARASTVAVVVPSPATSLVLVATSLLSWAPMFSNGSSSSISLAIVTPSLVIVGAPHFLSSTTFWPLGPSVMATASASLSTPASSARRASSPNFSSFDCHGASFVHRWNGARRACRARAPAPKPGWLLADDGEDVAGGQDQVLLALDLDLGAAVLGVDDLVADRNVERDAVRRPRTGPGRPPRRCPPAGFSLAVSGITRPEEVISSPSLALTTIRSSSGLRLKSFAILPPPCWLALCAYEC